MIEKRDKVLEGMKLVIEGFGEKYGIDPNDENFRGTPERVTRMYDECFGGNKTIEKDVKAILDMSFPTNYDEMVMVRKIRTHTWCPHHLQPVEITCDLAYIAKKDAIGLSKLNRLVLLLSKRLILQEQLTHDIAEYLETCLSPKGVMVKIVGKHKCVAARGVRDLDSDTLTSDVRGCFRDPKEKARDEFIQFASER